MSDRHPLRSNDIREQNEKLVLHLIYSNRGISQSEVANLTGLKPPTVFRIFSTLEGELLIRPADETVITPDKKGRRPSPYVVVPEAHFSIGVDFWARTAAVAVFDFSARVIYQRSVNFPAGVDAGTAVDQVIALIEEAVVSSLIPRDKILGIGIGAPGIVDIETGVVVAYDRIRGMNRFDIRTRIEEHFSAAVVIHNNCSVIALGAYRYGSVHGETSLVAFLIRSGLGGAFIHDGHLYVNQGRTAFEIGRIAPIFPSAKSHAHGGLPDDRSLEDYICEDAILQTARDSAGAESWEDIDRLLLEKNRALTEGLSVLGRIFSQTARNLTHLLNPDAILIISRSQPVSDYFGQELRNQMAAAHDEVLVDVKRIIPTAYDPLPACRGAADLVFDDYFALPH
ncbi:MAG TPA: ROK family transcriptional regulator [Spirochaetia bacterium]|nr:ROK family transcriptional regulator [Spirochaetia bacterium]